MILKELDPFFGDAQELATRIAADRLAYHLRRFYRHSIEIDVINDLSIRTSQSTARADHLLIHSHGLLVLEREDVPGQVRIDDDGQWLRCTPAQDVSMGSPITRAYVQALLLKAFLDKRVRQKGFFDTLELDVLVVVADDCAIEWPQTGRLAEVCSREEVSDRVNARVAQSREMTHGNGPLNASERRALGRFLRSVHRPTPHADSD